jgi:flagella basal body P-ring formation protein FlgA
MIATRGLFHHNMYQLNILMASLILLVAFNHPCDGTMLTAEMIRTVLQGYVVENSVWKVGDIEVRVLSSQSVSLELAGAKFRIIRPINGITPGLQNFLIAAESDGREQARFWVRADVRLFENVVVSSQALSTNEIVTDKEIRLERRDVSTLSARPFYRIDDVIGQQVARAISVNEPLTHRNLSRPTLMRRGSAVTLIYETGSLRIEAAAIAEENGRAGEIIQVKNPSSGRFLRATVLDGRSVRIER